MVRIKDIAEHCHRSTATVSKALHDSPELSPQTIEKIKRCAKKMGYVPNAYAQALKLKRSYSIGIVFYDSTTKGGLRHEFFSGILESLKFTAEENGYAITFLSRNKPNSPRPRTYYEAAQFRNRDGVIIVSENFEDPEIVALVHSNIPVITIDYIFPGTTAIRSDNLSGTGKLVDYAASLGHKTIAYIHGERTDVTKKRRQSYTEARERNHLPILPGRIKQAEYHDPKSSGRETKRLLALGEKPTCILYPDDVSILGGLTALKEAGLEIPEDVSVIGYDGAEISRINRPMVTTWVQDSEELGSKAAEELIDEIEHPDTYVSKIVKVSGKLQPGATIKAID